MITKEMLDEHLEKTGHSLFGPSSLTRREICPASAAEELAHPDQETSPYAAIGSGLHEAMECRRNHPVHQANL